VYDLTEFAKRHPAGGDAIWNVAGTDASMIFHSVHTLEMLEEFIPIGKMKATKSQE